MRILPKTKEPTDCKIAVSWLLLPLPVTNYTGVLYLSVFLVFQDDVKIRRPCGGFLHFGIYASHRGWISFALFFTSIGTA